MSEPGRPDSVTSARFRPVGHPAPWSTVTIDLTGAAADIIHALGKAIPPDVWEKIFHAKDTYTAVSTAALAARYYPVGVAHALTPTLTIFDAVELGDDLLDAISVANKETSHDPQDTPPPERPPHLAVADGADDRYDDTRYRAPREDEPGVRSDPAGGGPALRLVGGRPAGPED